MAFERHSDTRRRALRTVFSALFAALLLTAAAVYPTGAVESLTWEIAPTPAVDQTDMVIAMAITSDGVLFASAQNSGLYRSLDTGATWQQITGGETFVTGLSAVGTTVYRFAMDGSAVSTDHGTTWQPFGGDPVAMPQTVLATSGGALLAGTQQSGLFRSTDGGTSWSRTLEGAEIRAVVEAPDGVLFASVIYHPGWGSGEVTTDSSGIYRSTDGGSTWLRTALLGKNFVALAVSHTNILLAGSQEEGGSGRVFRSTDGGASWTTTTLQDIATSLVPLPDGSFLATAANSGVYRSADGGRTWSTANNGIADVRMLGMARHPSGYLFAFGVWGMVYRSAVPLATGIKPHAENSGITVATDVSAGKLLFTVATAQPEPVSVTLFDRSGRTVGSITDAATTSAERHLHFSVHNLACGVYFYLVATPSAAVPGSIPVFR